MMFGAFSCIEVAAEGAEVIVEEIVDQAIDLDVIRHVIRCVKIDLCVTRKRLVQVRFVSKEHLIACGDQIRPNFHFGVSQY